MSDVQSDLGTIVSELRNEQQYVQHKVRRKMAKYYFLDVVKTKVHM